MIKVLNIELNIELNSELKQGILYGASMALMKGMSLLMLPLIAHYLSPEQFGQLEVISTLAVIGSILVGMGMQDTLYRFAGMASSKRAKKQTAADIYSLTLLIGLLFAMLGCYFAANIAQLTPGQPATYEVQLVLALLALEGCIAVPLAWLRMNKRAIRFCLATTGRALVQAVLVITQLQLGRTVAGILEAGLLAALLQAILLGVWQFKDTGFSFHISTGKKSLRYSLPIVASGLVAFTLNGLDRWILASHTSMAEVAQFAVAAKFALAMVLLLQPFTMWWSARRFDILKERDGRQKVARFIMLGSSLALLTAVLVGLAAPIIITLLLPAGYAQAGQYALGLVMVMLVKEWVELFNMGCFIGKTTATQFVINTLAACIGVSAMLFFTPLFGVWGVIGSLLLAQSVRLLCFYKASQFFLTLHYPLHYPLTTLCLFSGLGVLFLAIGSQLTSLWQLSLVIALALFSLVLSAHGLKLIDLRLAFNNKVAD